ncbi:MAG: hypothetical protein AMS17_14020 [Spirochaetes bacterium DG_61]|nr:MAG: hypothetical protein AMS17_14020 [Spirochaetes bacterium DG_61]
MRHSLRFLLIIMLMFAFSATMLFGMGSKEEAVRSVKMLVMSGPEADYVKSISSYYNSNVTPASGAELNVEELGRSAYFDKIKTALLAKSKEFDIAWMINSDIAQYAKAGVIEPLDSYFEDSSLYPYDIDNYLPIAIDGVKYKGEIYAFPLWISTMFLYYRNDLVVSADIDTWSDFLETAKEFTKNINPASPTEYGTTVFGQKFVTLPMEWYVYLWSFGGELIENGRPAFNSSAGVKALEFYVRLVNEGVVPPDYHTYEYSAILNALKTGKVAFVIQWDAAFFDLKNTWGDKLSIKNTPRMEGGSAAAYTHTWTAAVNGASENKEAAFKVLAWLTSDPEGSVMLGEKGLPIPTEAVLLNEEFASSAPHWKTMYDVILKYGKAKPLLVSFPQIEEILINYLSKALAGEMSPQDALDAAAEEAREAMEAAGEYR